MYLKIKKALLKWQVIAAIYMHLGISNQKKKMQK